MRGRRPPRSCASLALAFSSLRPTRTTSAPAPASPSAIAPHNSPVPPMTTATFSWREKSELRKSADFELATRAVFYLHNPAVDKTQGVESPRPSRQTRAGGIRAPPARRPPQTASGRRQTREAARSGSSRARGRRSGWHRRRAGACPARRVRSRRRCRRGPRAVAHRRMLECADDRRADRDDSAAARRACARSRAPSKAGCRTARRTAAACRAPRSPVEEMPAACVIVAKPMSRARSAAIICQSSAKPADGGSNATGGLAIGVHTSHSASGVGTCAYWTGRPWCAIPDQISSGDPSKCSEIRRACPRRPVTVADSGPSASASPGASAGGCGRSSVLV